jgi:release factor glutamine methyltransferase
MTRVADAISSLARWLASSSPSARLDAEILVAHVLGERRAALVADPGRPLSAAQVDEIEALGRRREAGEPIAYLTGRREFWSLELEITPEVLVPRQETELVVELALAALARVAAPSVLDLGTGCGAIALALAVERKDARVTGTDVSEAALVLAARNAMRLGVTNVEWLCGSWYEPVGNRRFDAVLANPPYVAPDDPALASLAREPRLALVAPQSGLGAIGDICAGASAHLGHGGFLALEHGAGQGAPVRALVERAGLTAVTTHRDLAGLERVTTGGLGTH